MDEQTTPNELPTDLGALTPDQLDEALSSARSEAEGLRGIDPAEMTEEQVTRLEQLADFADSVAAEQTSRQAAAQERADRAAAAAQRIEANGGDGEPGDGDEGDEGAEGDAAPAPEATGTEEQPEAVAASGGRTGRVPAPAPRRSPVPAERPASAATLVASADVPGFSAGQTLETMGDVARAFIARSRGFAGIRPQAGMHIQHNVLTIDRGLQASADGLHFGNQDFGNDQYRMQRLLERAADESRLSGGSLARSLQSLGAAGGWCAPSTTEYGLVADETLDGIYQGPTVGIDRGGINRTLGPDFSDIYASAGFAQTEAQAIAGTTKACVEVDCPDFEEFRLDAVGICVKAPLLTRAAYPELVERWLTGTVIANAHKVNARVLSAMAAELGTALAPTLTGTPITWSVLTMLELHIEGERQAYRLSESQTLEVVAPRWLRAAIRADLANRAGMGADLVTNAQIDAHFANRGAVVQWVLGWQELSAPLTRVTFPSTVQVMCFPAGTFVKGTADVISLDTVYDTADLQTNVYTAAFAEDGVLVARMKYGGALITFPVHITGQLGAADLNQTYGTAQVLSDI